MAKLENLKEFDTEFQLALETIKKLDRMLARSHREWTPDQRAQIDVIFDAMMHLANAMSYLVHNNR